MTYTYVVTYVVTYTISKQWTNCLAYSSCLDKYCVEAGILNDIITGPFYKGEQNSSLKIFYQMCFGEWYALGGLLLSIMLDSWKGTRTIHFQSNEPLIKFHDHPFYKNLTCPWCITYNPYLRLLEILSTPKASLYYIWAVIEQMAVSKFLSDAFGGNTTWWWLLLDHFNS